jgi:hypothetical protein
MEYSRSPIAPSTWLIFLATSMEIFNEAELISSFELCDPRLMANLGGGCGDHSPWYNHGFFQWLE